MKVLFLTKYTQLGASSRYRTFQHIAGLEDHGIEVETQSLLDEGYLRSRFGGGRSRLAGAVAALGKRALELSKARRFDLVVIEKELFPYLTAGFEKLLLKLTPRYTLDFDDALFHIYDDHRREWVRRLLGRKFEPLLAGARLVTVGNPYLAEYCSRFAGEVREIPTVLDLRRYEPSPPTDSGDLTLGWIGTPVSAHNLERIAKPLQRYFQEASGKLLLIGAAADYELPGVPIEVVPWSEETEVDSLKRIDVGLMPLWDRPLERGKSGLKLLQYLALARPAVASPVGVNESLLIPEAGFLPETEEQWLDALKHLQRDAQARREMGQAGRRMVEEHYSLAHWTPRYAELLKEAAAA